MASIGGETAPDAPTRVVGPGQFKFAAAFLDHNHIVGQCSGLVAAGAELKWIYDPDPQKAAALAAQHPGARAARDFDEVLADPEVGLVTAAGVPCEHAPIGCRVMEAGKDYFTDKAPLTDFDQLARARAVVKATSRKYMVNFGERIDSPCAGLAGQLVREGAIGRVVQIMGFGPHRLNRGGRPDWFFQRAKYGGILCDLGSHQFEQFLFYSGAKSVAVARSAVGNYGNPDRPELEDFGEVSLLGDNGVTGYIRVDWMTPTGLRTWGDGRSFILGTKGFMELRKHLDLARPGGGDQIFLADEQGERVIDAKGRVELRFYSDFVLDCRNRTENSMTQEHVFQAAEIGLQAQAAAVRLT